MVEKNIELEIKDIELKSQKKNNERLSMKVCHLNQQLEIKSLHISELEKEIGNLHQKWKSNKPDNQRKESSFSELEVKDLKQKLVKLNQISKSANEKALKDHIRIELLQNTIEKQETHLQNQRDSILELQGENKLLSQKLASAQSVKILQRIAKKRKTQLEAQKVSNSKTITSCLPNSENNDNEDNDDAYIAQRNSKRSEKLNNQWMEKKEHYQAKTIPGFGNKQEEVPIIDLTEHFTEEKPTGLCDDNYVNEALPSDSNIVKHDVLSSEEFIDHISEMTNEIEFEQDKEVAQTITILSTIVEKNESQKVTRKSFEVILPGTTSIGHISEDKKDVKFRQYKEALVFKSTLANKNKASSKLQTNKCKICSKGFETNCY